MSPPFHAPAVAMGLVLTVLVAGCNAGSADGPVTSSAPASPSAASTPVPSPRTATPSRSPSPSPSAPTQKTTAGLRTALLGLKDVPAGFEVESESNGDFGGKASSSRSECAALVRLLNARKVPGSRADAQISFSGGQEGPFVDESLDAMGTAQKARAFVTDFRTSVKKCRTVSLTISGVGRSPIQIREISFADVGDTSFAARFSATRAHSRGWSSSRPERSLERFWSERPSSDSTRQTPRPPPRTR